jgi:hypothetical protein
MREHDIERGMELVPTIDEVMEEQADEATKRIYREVRETLRVPFVNFVFRVVATEPAFFQPVWARLHPIARSQGFEAAADGLRDLATIEVEVGAVDTGVVGSELEKIRAFTRTIHHVVPKLLLCATAFDLDAGGDQPSDAAAGGHADELPDLDAAAPGMIDGAASIPMVDPTAAEGRLGELFRDIQAHHRHPGVATFYRSLGHWPPLLEGLWQALRPLVGSEPFAARRQMLIDAANEEMLALRAGARAAGLLEDDLPALPADQRERLRAILAVFRLRIIPDLALIVPQARRLLGA